MDLNNLSLYLLHKKPEFMQQCCDLINSEWPRSNTARMRSLESSRDRLPTCLILVQNNKVIGHCKLTPIPSIKDACFIESVIIERQVRGNGLGTFLMIKSEEYCKNILQLNEIYLSTKGQEEFYSKLGYSICEPISIYGSMGQSRIFEVSSKDNNKKQTNTTFLSSATTKTYMKKSL